MTAIKAIGPQVITRRSSSPGREGLCSPRVQFGIVFTTPGRSTSQGMAVYYHDSSGRYVAYNYYANIIAPAKQKSC